MSTKIDPVLLRLPEVKLRTALSRSSIYARVADGTFCAPVKIGMRSIAFVSLEIQAWIDARINGISEDGIRELVKKQVALRRLSLASGDVCP